jgi:hypothetical protein
MCNVLLPPGVNPVAVHIYIVSYDMKINYFNISQLFVRLLWHVIEFKTCTFKSVSEFISVKSLDF